MSALVVTGLYLSVAVVMGAVAVYFMSRDGLSIDWGDYFMGGFVGLLWPVMLPIAVVGWGVYRFYTYLGRTFAPKDTVDK